MKRLIAVFIFVGASAGWTQSTSYRSASGKPGPAYWQQRVDYTIDATLDPANNEVRGQERITYSNRSPDTLTYLWFHV